MLKSTPEYAAAHRRELAASANSADLSAFLANRRAQRRAQFTSLLESMWRKLPHPRATIDDALPADPEPSL